MLGVSRHANDSLLLPETQVPPPQVAESLKSANVDPLPFPGVGRRRLLCLQLRRLCAEFSSLRRGNADCGEKSLAKAEGSTFPAEGSPSLLSASSHLDVLERHAQRTMISRDVSLVLLAVLLDAVCCVCPNAATISCGLLGKCLSIFRFHADLRQYSC